MGGMGRVILDRGELLMEELAELKIVEREAR